MHIHAYEKNKIIRINFLRAKIATFVQVFA